MGNMETGGRDQRRWEKGNGKGGRRKNNAEAWSRAKACVSDGLELRPKLGLWCGLVRRHGFGLMPMRKGRKGAGGNGKHGNRGIGSKKMEKGEMRNGKEQEEKAKRGKGGAKRGKAERAR